MKNKLVIVSLLVMVALCAAVPVLAQDELTLESLAEQLQALTDKVTALTERVDSIEALWDNSETAILLDGSCIVGSRGGVQDSTVLSYKKTFDEWPETDKFRVAGVSYNPETGVIGIQYTEIYESQTIIEFWQGCEFVEGTDWWESRYSSDEPFEGYTVLSEGDE